MSKKQQNSSGIGTALLGGLIAVGIGALGAFIGGKIADQAKKNQPRAEEYSLPTRRRRISVPESEQQQQVTHSPSFQQTLECPISQELMEDPVTLSNCGHSFDRKCIIPVLDKYNICPLCRKPADSENIVPNYQLKHVIDHYRTTKK